MPLKTGKRRMDLGPGDVHVPGAGGRMRRGPKTSTKVPMAIRAAKRDSLKPGQFALPSQRKYPIHDAAHARNAASRLEQAKKGGKISDGDYRTARAAIRRAAKRFGIRSELADGPQRVGGNVHVRAQLGAGGHLHVRNMTEDGRVSVVSRTDGTYCLYDYRPITMGAEVDPAQAGVTLRGAPAWRDGTPKKLVWVQLAETGAWSGHPAGPFKMDGETFAQIVQNFDRRALPVPFDMDHASEAEPTSGSIPLTGAPAHGWVHRLENRDAGGLWGLVEWLDYARDGIKSGQFAFVSPAIRFGAKDPKTGQSIGARLTSAAITNQPFLTHLEGLKAASDRATAQTETQMAQFQIPGGAKALLATLAAPVDEKTVTVRQADGKMTIELSDGGGPGSRLAHKPHQYMPAIKSALKIHELSSYSDTLDHFDKLRDMVDESDDAEGKHASGVDLGEFTRPLKNLIDAQPGDTWDEVFDAVRSLIRAAMDEHMVEEHGESEPESSAEATDRTHTPATVGAQPAVADSSTGTSEDTAMATAAMDDKVKELSDKVAARDALLTSKDAEIKALADKATKLEGDLKASTDKLAEHAAGEEKRVVSERHSIYKDSRKMSLEAMTALYKSDRALFDKEFPHVEAGQSHLQRNLTGATRQAEQTSVGGEAPAINVRALAHDIARQRGLTLGQAQVLALDIAKGRKQAA